jgi:hypothetical protein
MVSYRDNKQLEKSAFWVTTIFYDMTRRRREFSCKAPERIPKEFKSVLSNNIPIVSTIKVTRVRV